MNRTLGIAILITLQATSYGQNKSNNQIEELEGVVAGAEAMEWHPPTIQSLAEDLLEDPTVLAAIGVTREQLNSVRVRASLKSLATGYGIAKASDQNVFFEVNQASLNPLISWSDLSSLQRIRLRRVTLQKNPNQSLLALEIQDKLNLSKSQRARLASIQQQFETEFYKRNRPKFGPLSDAICSVFPDGGWESGAPSPARFEDMAQKYADLVCRSIPYTGLPTESEVRASFKKILTPAQLADFRKLQTNI